MREIKFRAWDSQQTIWVDEYVDLLHDGGLAVSGAPTDFDLDDIDPRYVTLQFYTGLKDKNGVEIYEGDILRAGENQKPTEMRWAEHGAAWMTYPIHTYPADWSEHEVIGNIYKNKELLETK